ncbi:MAG: TRAP transporter large permease subunit [Rhodoferax sp.]|nr:TRAP transporter large permease subunit [Rhodoferax sp.]MCB2008428.1 TRAP transporter large permease subunit [Rhodoferax sp.]MCB2029617.1 TRAP transporter large permease subunit [Rhodoferax sp.]MCB2039476.1 TRAP transporter large permease subunit [Rhodoferax sp.]MCP5263592.1 TRAP transporter large permease subunit [Rhodoferax sp.]
MTTSALLIVLLFVLLAGGVWIAITLGIVAWAGVAFFSSTRPDINLVTSYWNTYESLSLASLPMFIWMGEILYRTRLAEQMFAGLAPWLDRLPGRLLHVNVLGCGIFGAVSGSSAATCATIAKIALPELSRRGYDEKMSLGALCGASTLGLLIPPSIAMIVYAVAADVSIIRMFIAGILPGAMLLCLFSGYIVIWALLNPHKTPKASLTMSLGQRIKASGNLIPVLLLIAFVFSAMVSGFATANEASAFGVLGALCIAGFGGSLSRKSFVESLSGAVRMSCMIMFILGAASFLTVAMGFTGIPIALSKWVVSLELSPYALIAALTVVYLVMGCALDGVSMIVLTTAVVLPMVQAAGFDPIWFGVYIIIMIELSQITPPVGFNLFVLQGMTGQRIMTVARASLPFFVVMIVATILLVAYPSIATWLPQAIMGR